MSSACPSVLGSRTRFLVPEGNPCHNSQLGDRTSLIYVTVQPNESIDSALKRFNMKMQQSGLLREYKEHSHYEKPSEKRRRMARRRSSRQ